VREKVNEDLSMDKPLHVIQNHSKLAYRSNVILIANKEFSKNIILNVYETNMKSGPFNYRKNLSERYS
jgi:hypothetical protein